MWISATNAIEVADPRLNCRERPRCEVPASAPRQPARSASVPRRFDPWQPGSCHAVRRHGLVRGSGKGSADRSRLQTCGTRSPRRRRSPQARARMSRVPGNSRCTSADQPLVSQSRRCEASQEHKCKKVGSVHGLILGRRPVPLQSWLLRLTTDDQRLTGTLVVDAGSSSSRRAHCSRRKWGTSSSPTAGGCAWRWPSPTPTSWGCPNLGFQTVYTAVQRRAGHRLRARVPAAQE